MQIKDGLQIPDKIQIEITHPEGAQCLVLKRIFEED